MSAPAFFANGNISPCRFVKIDSTAGKSFHVIQSSASTDRSVGISQEGTHDTPGLSGSTAYAAAAGQQLEVHGLGAQCLLEIGGTVTHGDLLRPDSNGKGVSVDGTEATDVYIAAQALENGISGDKIRVRVILLKQERQQYTLALPIDLASITGAGDVLTNMTIGHSFKLISVDFFVTKPVTTAAKAATLNLEINTTNVTGGEVALTSANCTPLGVKVAGSAITAANTGNSSATLSVEAASVTAFVEGEGVLMIRIENRDESN